MNLSVITAVRNTLATNRREKLGHCVESITALTIPLECLIYNAASSNGRFAVPGKWSDNHDLIGYTKF